MSKTIQERVAKRARVARRRYISENHEEVMIVLLALRAALLVSDDEQARVALESADTLERVARTLRLGAAA